MAKQLTRKEVATRLSEHYSRKFNGNVIAVYDASRRVYEFSGSGLPAHPDLKEQYPNGWSLLDSVKPTEARKLIAEPLVLKPEDINLPDSAEETVHTVIGDKVVFVTIEHDQDCPNPCTDMDGMGHVRSMSSRHINNISYEEAKALLETDVDAIALSYYEHGNSMWMVMGDQPAGVEFQWDGRRFAGIWIPDDTCRSEGEGMEPAARRARMLEMAGECCTEYTAWANGECYGFIIKAYDVIRDDDGEPMDDINDYRRKKALYDDSCWGHIGWDYALEATKEALPDTL